MAKVTIEYDAVEEAHELELALNGWKWKAAMYELDQALRSTVKYGTSVLNKESADNVEIDIAEKYRELIRDLLAGSNIYLD